MKLLYFNNIMASKPIGHIWFHLINRKGAVVLLSLISPSPACSSEQLNSSTTIRGAHQGAQYDERWLLVVTCCYGYHVPRSSQQNLPRALCKHQDDAYCMNVAFVPVP